MFSIRACASAALAILVSASPIRGEDRPGISTIRMEFSVSLSSGLCQSAVASFELSFPDGSGVSPESNSSLMVDLTPTGELQGAGCSESGLICAEHADVSEGGRSIAVIISLDAGALPDGVFGECLQLKASLISLEPGRGECDLPAPSTVRIYTSCMDPPAPGDIFRRGDSGLYKVLEVFPPACGFVPISTVPQTWGGIKAIYR